MTEWHDNPHYVKVAHHIENELVQSKYRSALRQTVRSYECFQWLNHGNKQDFTAPVESCYSTRNSHCGGRPHSVLIDIRTIDHGGVKKAGAPHTTKCWIEKSRLPPRRSHSPHTETNQSHDHTVNRPPQRSRHFRPCDRRDRRPGIA